ncbi:MAG: cupin domain-containing protein [Actinomycetota bacterium]|nr:cupin domain-containing protein [Actinomycetota bacterium]
MSVITPQNAQQVETMEGFEGRYSEIDGYVIGFETYTADADPAELFRGLPDDRCQCPHWGVVLRGELVYRNGDGTEDRIGPGQAYYVGPGHLPLFTAGTEIVEFSPAAPFHETVQVVLGNLTAATP